MLVLSRKQEESVVVGGSNNLAQVLKVTVLEIGTEQVKLGFEAHGDVPVHRWEVWEQIRADGGLPGAGAVMFLSAGDSTHSLETDGRRRGRWLAPSVLEVYNGRSWS